MVRSMEYRELNRLGEIPLVWKKTRGELRGKSIIKSWRRRVRNRYALCNTGTLKAKQRKHSFTQCIVSCWIHGLKILRPKI